MRILPLMILAGTVFFLNIRNDHPHGEGFKVSCSKCHSSKGWFLDREIYSFDHNTTKMPLTGGHINADCRACHLTLVFSEAKTGCIDCHNDVHEATTGPECSRCHTTESWLVNNITELHRLSRFPLLGAHRTADCDECHKSASEVRFDVPGINCVDCHFIDYQATMNPNHAEAGFSQDCSTCHSINAFTWGGAGFNHSFFPLVQGHSGPKCNDCHITGRYSDANPDCNTCHNPDYMSTANPNHNDAGFPLNCSTCHTLNPGWTPASFRQHDSQHFPIYSGRHSGKWDSCTDCHPNISSFAEFTCLSCHEHNRTEMDDKHRDETGYSYSSPACLQCHPTGNADK